MVCIVPLKWPEPTKQKTDWFVSYGLMLNCFVWTQHNKILKTNKKRRMLTLRVYGNLIYVMHYICHVMLYFSDATNNHLCNTLHMTSFMWVLGYPFCMINVFIRKVCRNKWSWIIRCRWTDNVCITQTNIPRGSLTACILFSMWLELNTIESVRFISWPRVECLNKKDYFCWRTLHIQLFRHGTVRPVCSSSQAAPSTHRPIGHYNNVRCKVQPRVARCARREAHGHSVIPVCPHLLLLLPWPATISQGARGVRCQHGDPPWRPGGGLHMPLNPPDQSQ